MIKKILLVCLFSCSAYADFATDLALINLLSQVQKQNQAIGSSSDVLLKEYAVGERAKNNMTISPQQRFGIEVQQNLDAVINREVNAQWNQQQQNHSPSYGLGQ